MPRVVDEVSLLCIIATHGHLDMRPVPIDPFILYVSAGNSSFSICGISFLNISPLVDSRDTPFPICFA